MTALYTLASIRIHLVFTEPRHLLFRVAVIEHVIGEAGSCIHRDESLCAEEFGKELAESFRLDG